MITVSTSFIIRFVHLLLLSRLYAVHVLTRDQLEISFQFNIIWVETFVKFTFTIYIMMSGT